MSAAGAPPRWARRDGGLPAERARSRASAFVYGNTTVLGAVLSAGAASTRDGSAVLVVVVTAVTTFVAHVVADAVAAPLGRREQERDAVRREVVDEVRDAAPIATSGAVPALLLGLGAVGALSPVVAQLAAAGVVVARLAVTGPVAARLTGRAASPAARWGGLVLAAVAVVIAVVKAVAGH